MTPAVIQALWYLYLITRSEYRAQGSGGEVWYCAVCGSADEPWPWHKPDCRVGAALVDVERAISRPETAP